MALLTSLLLLLAVAQADTAPARFSHDDWTRVLSVNTYAQDTIAFFETDELSTPEKERLFGGTLRKVMRWPRVE